MSSVLDETSIRTLRPGLTQANGSYICCNLLTSQSVLMYLLQLKVPKSGSAQEAMSFRKLLLNRCQHEFETDQKEEGNFARMQVAIDSATSVSSN